MSINSVYKTKKIEKLFDMRDGYGSVKNVLGMSDPNVVYLDGCWTMFIGIMKWNFKTNIAIARLPKGAPITSNQWTFEMEKDGAWKVKTIIPQPSKGSWNRCMHSVCYAKGIVDGVEVERIYIAGRKAETPLNTTCPYKIGYLQKEGDTWRSIQAPLHIKGVLGGQQRYEGVLEPKVEFRDGYWHMRYLALKEVGDDKKGRHTILYSKSKDGHSDWSEPVEFFSEKENFFDSVCATSNRGMNIMAITRDSNLSNKAHYPPQGIWLSSSKIYSGDRSDWSELVRVLKPENDTEGWYVNGMCSPSIHMQDDRAQAHIFFVSATRYENWLVSAYKRLRRGKMPSVPAPFYFAIGRVDVDIDNK